MNFGVNYTNRYKFVCVEFYSIWCNFAAVTAERLKVSLFSWTQCIRSVGTERTENK